MKTRVFWTDNQTILHIQLAHEWTWQDLYKIQEQTHIVLVAFDDPIGVIIDVPFNAPIPTQAVAQGQHLLAYQHPLTRVTCVVSANPMVRMMVNLFNRQNHRDLNRQIHLADSVDAARDYILHKLHHRTYA